MNFTKIFSSIITSSIWMESPEVLKVFFYFVCNPIIDSEGVVKGSIPAMAHQCVMTIPQFEKALEILTSPDKYSRTEAHEGRRLIKVEGGWKVVNYRYYRDMKGTDSESRNEYMKDYMRGYRTKGSVNSVNSVNKNVNSVNSVNTDEDVDVDKTDLCSTRLAGEIEPHIDSSEKEKPTFDYKTEIQRLVDRYPDKQLLRLTWEALSSIRKTGRYADSVVYKHLLTWSRYSVEAVQVSCRLYLDKDMAATKKPPEYLSGMIRKAEEGLPEETDQTSLPSPRINHGLRKADPTALLAAREAAEAKRSEQLRAWKAHVLSELAKDLELKAKIEAQAAEKVRGLRLQLSDQQQNQALREHTIDLGAKALGLIFAESWLNGSPIDDKKPGSADTAPARNAQGQSKQRPPVAKSRHGPDGTAAMEKCSGNGSIRE